MENASKALLIAGGVLIAILVASLGVYFSKTMSEEIAVFYRELEKSKIAEFNQQFLNYNDSNMLNIQDIVTIINLAKDSNRKNDFEESNSPANDPSYDPATDNSFYINVRFRNGGYSLGGLTADACKKLELLSDVNIDKLVKNEMTKLTANNVVTYFSCKVYINSDTGYVKYIDIQ